MMRRSPLLCALLLLAAGLLPARQAAAEPHLAVAKGMKCITCHVNPTGGGKRTPYGNIYAQNELTARFLSPAGSPPVRRRVDLWILVALFVFGFGFILSATWFGKQERHSHGLEPPPPPTANAPENKATAAGPDEERIENMRVGASVSEARWRRPEACQ